MRCDRARAALAAYTAGLLRAEQAIRVAAHLERCEGCARAAAEYETLDARLSAEGPSSSEALVRQVLARVTPPSRTGTCPRWVTRANAAAAPAALVVSLPLLCMALSSLTAPASPGAWVVATATVLLSGGLAAAHLRTLPIGLGGRG